MSTATVSPSHRPTKGRTIAIWALRVPLALLFLAAAAMKLTAQPAMIAEFAAVGLGQWFRYLTAVLELAGAAALLTPRVSVIGAALLLLVDVGAFVAQVAILHMDWIHTIVIGALLVLTIALQQRRAR